MKDFFINISVQEILNITDNLLQLRAIDLVSKNKILQLMETVLFQNYFTFSGSIYQPLKGMAVGSPISSIIADIFLQYYENMLIKHLESRKIIYYTRYVDISIIYDKTMIDLYRLSNSINRIHKNIVIKPTSENNGKNKLP
jgi:hypothetical protein